MKDKQEQIEEMVGILEASNNPFVDVTIEIMPNVAEALYNAGYRKVSDSEAELQELNIKYYNEAKDLRREVAELKAENKRLSTKLVQILLSIDTVKEMNAMCNIDDHRKQAVKEFAEKLKEKFDEQKHFYETASISHRDISLTALYTAYKYLDETLKEYEK